MEAQNYIRNISTVTPLSMSHDPVISISNLACTLISLSRVIPRNINGIPRDVRNVGISYDYCGAFDYWVHTFGED